MLFRSGLTKDQQKTVSGSPMTPDEAMRGLTWQERLMGMGSILQGDTQAAMAIPMMRLERAKLDAQRDWGSRLGSAIAGAGGPPMKAPDGPAGGAPSAEGVGSAPGANIPMRSAAGPVTARDVLPILLEGAQRGYNIAPYLSALEATAPDYTYVNGVRVDQRDRNAPREITEVDKGQVRLYDAAGNFMGVRNADGYIQSVADLEAAKARAQEGAKAEYDLVEVPMADGSTRMLPRSQALGAMGGGAMAGMGQGGGMGVSPGGFGVRPSKAQETYDVDRAKSAAEIEALTPKATAAYNAMDRKTDFVIEQLRRAKEQVSGGLGGSAGMNEVGKFVPGTNARNLAATLDTLMANLGFNELAEMRANSPTGGAVGSLTERELTLLGSVMGSLDQGQDPDQLRANIDRMIRELETVRDERRAAFGQQYGRPAGGGGRTQAPANPRGYSLEALEAEARRRGLK